MTDSVSDVSVVSHIRHHKGAELAQALDLVDGMLSKYIAWPSIEARHATAAWVAHTWTINAFESTPRLAFLSAEKGSGKSRALEVVCLLTPGARLAVSMSPAALFRIIELPGACTILLDEADTYLGAHVSSQHEDLRGLINAGYRRGAVAYRCDISGKGVEVKEFPAFAPVALAGIGDLPDTIMDRSVIVSMKRRRATEHVEPYRARRADREAIPITERLVALADDITTGLEDYEPELPPGIVDRPADVWEPLIMIGDIAGPEWSAKVRAAAVELNALRQRKDPSLGAQLLADVRTVFEVRKVDRLPTNALLEALIAMDESPWGDLRGRPLDSRGLARRLKPYEVRPGQHRFGPVTSKGYLAEDFHDAFERYLPTPEGGGEIPPPPIETDETKAERLSTPESAKQPKQPKQPTHDQCAGCGIPTINTDSLCSSCRADAYEFDVA